MSEGPAEYPPQSGGQAPALSPSGLTLSQCCCRSAHTEVVWSRGVPAAPQRAPSAGQAAGDLGGHNLESIRAKLSGHGAGQAGRTQGSDWASERRSQRAGAGLAAGPQASAPALPPSVLGAPRPGTQPRSSLARPGAQPLQV